MADEFDIDGQPVDAPSEEVSEQAVPEVANVVRIGDKEVPYEELERVYKDYSNDTSWRTKNTQEAQRISEQRKELQAAQQLEEHLRNHPEDYVAVKAIFEKRQGSQVKGEMLPPQVAEAVRKIEDRARVIEERAAAIEVKDELAQVKGRYREYFDSDPELGNKIVRHALERGLTNLDDAFKTYYWDKLKESSIKQGIERAKAGALKSRSLANAAPGGKGSGEDPMKALKGKGFNTQAVRDAIMNHPAMKEWDGE